MNIVQYFRDTRGELKQVHWPNRHQTLVFTTLVIVFSLIVAVLLGFFDFVFNLLLKMIIQGS